MANNQLLASDNFASGSLAAGWSTLPGAATKCQVIAGSPNFTEGTSVGATSSQTWTGLTWPADQTSEVTIGPQSAASVVTLNVRTTGTSSQSGYQCNINGSTTNTLVVYKFTAGSFVQLGSTVSGLTISSGDVFS